MISLISSALIIGLSPCQPLAHLRQLAVETSVNDVAADLRDEAAEQGGVHAFLEEDALAEHAFQLVPERLLLRVAEGGRRAHGGARLAEILVDEGAVPRDDLAEVIHAAALGYETHKIGDDLPAPRPLRDGLGDRAA